MALLHLSWDHTPQVTETLCTSRNDHESAVSIDLGITSEFKPVGEFTNIESANNENPL